MCDWIIVDYAKHDKNMVGSLNVDHCLFIVARAMLQRIVIQNNRTGWEGHTKDYHAYVCLVNVGCKYETKLWNNLPSKSLDNVLETTALIRPFRNKIDCKYNTNEKTRAQEANSWFRFTNQIPFFNPIIYIFIIRLIWPIMFLTHFSAAYLFNFTWLPSWWLWKWITCHLTRRWLQTFILVRNLLQET